MGPPPQPSRRASQIEALALALQTGRCVDAELALEGLRRAASMPWARRADREALSAALLDALPLGTPQQAKTWLTELATLAKREGSSSQMASNSAVAQARYTRLEAERLPFGGQSFDELEEKLSTAALEPAQWLDAMVALRRLAEANADPSVAPQSPRRRFAQRWINQALGAHVQGPDAVENDRKAYLWTLPAAHRGDAGAQLLLGHCYRRGRGVAKDREQALSWYRQAAVGGLEEARVWTCLGGFEPKGVLLSQPRVVAWFAGIFGILYLLVELGHLPPQLVSAYVLVAVLACAGRRWMASYRGSCDA